VVEEHAYACSTEYMPQAPRRFDSPDHQSPRWFPRSRQCLMAHADEPCRKGASVCLLSLQPISPHPHKSSECMALLVVALGEKEDDAHATCPMDHDTPLFRSFPTPTPSHPTIRDGHRLAATSDFPSDQNSWEAAARGIPSCVRHLGWVAQAK
jgi:hypothetical protein